MDILKKLEDKKTKQIVAIVGTILIIIGTAGVFYWQVGAIELWKGELGEEDKPKGIIGGNETGVWVNIYNKTDRMYGGTGPVSTPMTTHTHTFNIKGNETEAYINLTYIDGAGIRDNLDLCVHSPKDDKYTSEGEDSNEQVHLKKNTLEKGGSGEWEANVKGVTGFYIDYRITVDVFYITNETANNTTALNQNVNSISFEKIIVKIEFLAREN